MAQEPCWVLCGSGLQVADRDLRELIAWPFKFNIEQLSIVLNPCLHLVFVSERKLTSHQHHCIHSSHQQCLGLYGPSVWQYGKHHPHWWILWQIPLSLPQTLPDIWYGLPCVWVQCRQFWPLHSLGFHWWFLERPHTLMATSSNLQVTLSLRRSKNCRSVIY